LRRFDAGGNGRSLHLKVLFVGDVVGRPGRRAVKRFLPGLIDECEIDFVVANAENAAGGFGLTPDMSDELMDYGIDCITMGNHVWGKKELIATLETNPAVLRPINYPDGVPGRGETVLPSKSGTPVGVISVCGTTFMDRLCCPFKTASAAVDRLRKQAVIILVDMHAEATSEKVALGKYLDGKVSAVIGTHTHVQTADEQILSAGTAYLTDCGMTGPVDSVLGMKSSLVMKRFLTRMPAKFEVASGPAALSAVVIDIDSAMGKASSIERITRRETEEQLISP